MQGIISIFLLCCAYCGYAHEIGTLTNDGNGEIIVPTEWGTKQYGVVFAWPTFNSFPESPTYLLLLEMFMQITSGNDRIFLLVGNQNEYKSAQTAIQFYNAGTTYGGVSIGPTIKESNVVYISIPHTDFWMRDYFSLGRMRNDSSFYAVGDFDFDAWGFGGRYNSEGDTYIRVSSYFNSISNTDTQIASKFASDMSKYQKLKTVNVQSWLRIEPGGLEFNEDKTSVSGSRRLIVSEAYLAQPERNFGKTIYDSVKELYRVFSVEDVIVLPKFRYNRGMGQEEVVQQCPMSDSALNFGGQEHWRHCFDPNSWYYMGVFGGGLVADDSTFIGTLKNEDSATRRDSLGFSDPVYDNMLTPLTTNGHTGEWIRWVGPNTVVLSDIPGGQNAPKSSIAGRSWYRLNVIYNLLKQKNIDVVRITTPANRIEYFGPGSCPYDSLLDMRFTKGEYFNPSTNDWVSAKNIPILSIFPKDSKVPFISTRSYLNYVVTDDKVLIAEYCSVDNTKESCDRDRLAKRTLSGIFDDIGKRTGIVRTVVQIKNVDKLNFCGGGMHCITQNHFE
jgi:agmatine/peptidylarginine deiminase